MLKTTAGRLAERADFTWRRVGWGGGEGLAPSFFSLLLHIECEIAPKGAF